MSVGGGYHAHRQTVKPKGKPTKRFCLKCEQPFISTGFFMCDLCRHVNMSLSDNSPFEFVGLKGGPR